MTRKPVLVFRGTGENRNPSGVPTGMLAEITRLVEQEDPSFSFYELGWSAVIGPVGVQHAPDMLKADSMELNVDKACDMAAAWIARQGEPVGLIGYSLGALVVSLLLSRINCGIYKNEDGSPLEISFVCNLANPARRQGESVLGLCGMDTYGLYGEHDPWPDTCLDRVFEYANPADLITSAAWDSPVRFISDTINPFSFLTLRLGDPLAQLKVHKNKDKYYEFWNPRFWNKYKEAAIQIIGYLTPWPDGEHVLYSSKHLPGTQLLWTEHAAQSILDLAKRGKI